MALTKKQLAVVEKMKRGGHIWMAGTHPYITDPDGPAGRPASTAVHKRTFEALVADNVIIKKDGENIYVLAEA